MMRGDMNDGDGFRPSVLAVERRYYVVKFLYGLGAVPDKISWIDRKRGTHENGFRAIADCDGVPRTMPQPY